MAILEGTIAIWIAGTVILRVSGYISALVLGH